MSDWASGYVSDIGYTYGAYNELNPLRLKLALLAKNIVPPSIQNACELGFGQGLSVNMHAASASAVWHGTDFNPAQAGFARDLSNFSGASLTDEAFTEFCGRDDLPNFDYIGLHGIWSWISDENRAVIADFVRRKLNVGGVLYISYNTLPGWASVAPLRHIMSAHANLMAAPGDGILPRIDGALDFAEKLLATNPVYAQVNPSVPDRLQKLKTQDKPYLAHEYFNRDWQPMYFSDMAEWLEPAKLTFAASAHLLDHVDAINMKDEQQALMNGIPDPQLRETVRDYMVNQQFRRDYWVKGPRHLAPLDQHEELGKLRFVLVAARSSIALKVNGVLGEANLAEAIYEPLLDLLSDHKIRTLAELKTALAPKGVNFPQLLQAIIILSGAGHVGVAQGQSESAAAKKRCKALNAHLMSKARGSGDVKYLASPVLGGGFSVPRFQQLFLLAASEGRKHPEDWADYAWNLLRAQGQKLIKNGKTVETDEDNLAELSVQAKDFAEKSLPILKALEIA